MLFKRKEENSEDGFQEIPVSFNNEGYRLYERLHNFYLEYHKIINEALEFLEPSYALNIHSHDTSDLSPL
jgi:hypothetical protein